MARGIRKHSIQGILQEQVLPGDDLRKDMKAVIKHFQGSYKTKQSPVLCYSRNQTSTNKIKEKKKKKSTVSVKFIKEPSRSLFTKQINGCFGNYYAPW